jgi:hypothetical protein
MDTLPARDLAACELAWMRCRRLVLSGGLWRRAIARLHAGTAGLPTTDEWVGRDPAASSALWRALAWELDAPPDDLSLLAHALGASSTDQPEEAVGNTLSPRARPDGRRAFERERHGVVVDDEEDVGGPHSTYWSSAGSDAPGPASAEWVAYRTVAPLVLVTALTVRPFRAYFQPGLPVYAPVSVQLCAGRDDLWAGAAAGVDDDEAPAGGRRRRAALPPPPSDFDPRAALRAATAAAAAAAAAAAGVRRRVQRLIGHSQWRCVG